MGCGASTAQKYKDNRKTVIPDNHSLPERKKSEPKNVLVKENSKGKIVLQTNEHSSSNNVTYVGLIPKNQVFYLDNVMAGGKGDLLRSWRPAVVDAIDHEQRKITLTFENRNVTKTKTIELDHHWKYIVPSEFPMAKSQLYRGVPLNPTQEKDVYKMLTGLELVVEDESQASETKGIINQSNITHKTSGDPAASLSTTANNKLKTRRKSMDQIPQHLSTSNATAKKESAVTENPKNARVTTVSTAKKTVADDNQYSDMDDAESPHHNTEMDEDGYSYSISPTKELVSEHDEMVIPVTIGRHAGGRLSDFNAADWKQLRHAKNPTVNIQSGASKSRVQNLEFRPTPTSGDSPSDDSFRPGVLERRRSSHAVVPSNSEAAFGDRMEQAGMFVVEVEGDGNCLFRSVAHQLYLDESRHAEIRQLCVDHMKKHKQRFEKFCTVKFDDHIKRMAQLGTWGDDLEIKSLEEILDRPFFIYSPDCTKNLVPVPINVNFSEVSILTGENGEKQVAPVKLSYHGSCHYNSIFDQRSPLPLPLRKSRTIMNARIKLFENIG